MSETEGATESAEALVLMFPKTLQYLLNQELSYSTSSFWLAILCGAWTEFTQLAGLHELLLGSTS